MKLKAQFAQMNLFFLEVLELLKLKKELKRQAEILKKIQQSPPRTGVYTTFFGPIFIDFGWFSVVFIFFFGVFQKLIYNKIVQGRFQFIPLLFYLLIINFFMPVFNFINGAQGLYNLISFGFFVLIYILLTGKLKISTKDGLISYVKILK